MKKIVFLFVCFILNGAVFGADLELSMLKLDFEIQDITKREQGFELINRSMAPINLLGYSIAVDGNKIFTVDSDIVIQPGKVRFISFKENELNRNKIEKYNQTSPIRISSNNHDPQYNKKESANLFLAKARKFQENLPINIRKQILETNAESLEQKEWRGLLTKIALLTKEDKEIDSILLTSLPLSNVNFVFAFWDFRMEEDFNYVFKNLANVITSNVSQIDSSLIKIDFDPEKKSLSAFTAQTKINNLHVDGLKTQLELFEDKDFQKKILTVNGKSLWYPALNVQKIEDLMRFFGNEYSKTVYYKLQIKHDLIPQLSLEAIKEGTCTILRPEVPRKVDISELDLKGFGS